MSPLPLPVTGTLSFANGSAVTVNNPASSPVLVRDVDRGTPFQMFAVSPLNVNVVGFGPVPAGQSWIIEHVSAQVGGDQVHLEGFDLFSEQNGHPVHDLLIAQNVSPTFAITSSQTKFILHSGEKVFLNMFGQVTLPSLSAFISGVIVPAP